MDSNQARRVDGRSSTEDSTNNDDHQPPIPTDEIDKICGFEPFSLKNHEKDFRDFLKTKFSKELDSLLQQAISKDDQEAFSSLLNKSTVITEKDWWSRPTGDQALKLGYAEVSIKNVLCYICRNKAINCARVLLQPGFGVNVNVQIPWHGRLGRRKFVDETTPLKWAAAELNSEFTKLFQSRGARVDESELQIAIAGFRKKLKWRRDESVAKLLQELRSLEDREDLNTIKRLTNDKSVVERTFEVFLNDHSVDGVAMLLMVAGEKVRSPKCAQVFEALISQKEEQSYHISDDWRAIKTLIKLFLGVDHPDMSHKQGDSEVSLGTVAFISAALFCLVLLHEVKHRPVF